LNAIRDARGAAGLSPHEQRRLRSNICRAPCYRCRVRVIG